MKNVNGGRVKPCRAMPGLHGAILFASVLILWCGTIVRGVGIDQAKPGEMPAGHPAIDDNKAAAPAFSDLSPDQIVAQDRTDFMQNIKLDQFRLLDVMNRDQVKILDSWARQSLSTMMHHESYEGQDPLYTALDMAFRPEAWQQKNIIFIQAVPIREQLSSLVGEQNSEGAAHDEQYRILHTGMVSPAFLEQREVADLLERTSAADVRLADSIGKVMQALETFQTLHSSLLLVPPAMGSSDTWVHPYQLQGDVPQLVAAATQRGETLPAVPGYTPTQAVAMVRGFGELEMGWRSDDVVQANSGIERLSDNAAALNASGYRGPFTRNVELWYNRFFNGTLLAASLYFIAITLFLIGAVGVTKALHKWAMGFFSAALAVHMLAMAIRWWLAQRIPIQNEFESIMGAAMLSCVAGLCLELWRRNNLFGLAFSFVGWMAMTMLFAVPFVWGQEIGESIAQRAGVLVTYWLYIHVTIVITSYGLIGASFIMGALYLSIKLWHWLNPIDEPGVQAFAAQAVGVSPGGAAVVQFGGGGGGGGASHAEIAKARAQLLSVIDGTNVVILQMAFWALGTGIVCGAMWADHSWGRPWGWDPKETFALVTWIVYLIIVHLRFVTGRNKAMWTAGLSVLGFAVMMFNWIGVNFFLAGLHSYA